MSKRVTLVSRGSFEFLQHEVGVVVVHRSHLSLIEVLQTFILKTNYLSCGNSKSPLGTSRTLLINSSLQRSDLHKDFNIKKSLNKIICVPSLDFHSCKVREKEKGIPVSCFFLFLRQPEGFKMTVFHPTTFMSHRMDTTECILLLMSSRPCSLVSYLCLGTS